MLFHVHEYNSKTSYKLPKGHFCIYCDDLKADLVPGYQKGGII